MSDLRKIALSNTNLKSMNNSPPNSGTSTPLKGKMEKTDSVLNLTKPELFGLYKNDSYVDLNKDFNETSESDINILLKAQSNDSTLTPITSNTNESTYNIPLPAKLVILSSSAYIYNEIIKHINYNHFNENQLVNFPLTITHVFLYAFVSKFKIGNYININGDILKVFDNIFALTLQGLLMASLHPIFDRILPNFFTRRLLSSNPNNQSPSSSVNQSNFFNDLIRSCITFLGISYAIRKIEWSSFLQVSIIWSLINPGLWLLLDGTISGFLSSLLVSTLACVSIYTQNYQFINQYSKTSDDIIALWLWIGSFFFCGIIIFGKIGRGIFGPN
ncbi:uncharacterized protein KGF55_000770 [Candida pseudojiufengensis]|uniref:uncharacterized protein n=1 Tax=Candida pseudojiufengensis TaxID=497109 RepID=UPI002224DB32|nr:uncharacterized protein KGF55_000770 [Candida pseudojiufengensis]KAI5966461.1 hypothetical protein KGF55_000770 [Candida pseudojiufengensis]